MILPSCKACSSPVREWMEYIRHWPWLRPLLLMMIVPQGCEDSTLLWWTWTGVGGLLPGSADSCRNKGGWVCYPMLEYTSHPMEARSGDLPAMTCLWVCNGWHWPAVLHSLAHTDWGSFLLVSWCMERRLGSTGQMWFHCPGWNWALFRCLLLWPTTTLANSSKSSFGYSFLPCCGGYSYQAVGGKQIHAQCKAYTSRTKGNRREKRGRCGHGCWRGKWIRAESGWSLTTPLLTQNAPSSTPSDQDRFDTAYETFRDLSAGLYDIDTRQYARGVTSDDAPGVKLSDGQAKLRELVHLSRNWPLARLTIPLGGLSKQIDRLLDFFSCIAGRVRDMVGQLLEIRVELKANWMQKFPWKREKQQEKRNPKTHPPTNSKHQHHGQGNSQN